MELISKTLTYCDITVHLLVRLFFQVLWDVMGHMNPQTKERHQGQQVCHKERLVSQDFDRHEILTGLDDGDGCGHLGVVIARLAYEDLYTYLIETLQER